MSPTLVFSNNQLIGVLGSPGGSRIICYVSKVAFEILLLEVEPELAITSPHYCSRGNFTEIENSHNNEELKKNLIKKGHNLKFKEMTSGLNVIWKKNNQWYGIADPRREGIPLGK